KEIRDVEDEVARADKSVARAKSRFRNLDRDISDTEKGISRSTHLLKSDSADLEKAIEGEKAIKKDLSKMENPEVLRKRLSELETEEVSSEERGLSEKIKEMERGHPLSSQVQELKQELIKVRANLSTLSRLEGNLETLEADLRSLKTAIRRGRS